jgi:hypothetical protein
MDLDHLANLAPSGSRRKLLSMLAGLPVAGKLLDVLSSRETEAAGRRQRRKKRHKHAKGRRRVHHKPRCKPEPIAQTCAGSCGQVNNLCQKAVDCGPCVCTPDCTGKCGDADDGCGGTCPGTCGANQICDTGRCQSCDVCADGCPHSGVQDAVNAARAGDTVRICPGVYKRLPTGYAVNIEKPLTLVGGGTGADGTIFDGEHAGFTAPLVTIDANPVELRDLAIKRGLNHTSYGGGLGVLSHSVATLTRVLISDNQCNRDGGGIIIDFAATLILNAGTIVSNNTAAVGGGIANMSTVTFNPGSSVTDNHPDDCANTFSGRGCPA